MLTGDENIVDLAFSVQWRVSDAAKYLFNVKDPDEAVKAVNAIHAEFMNPGQ